LDSHIDRSGHEKDTLAQKKSHAMNSSGSASQPNKESVGYQTIDQVRHIDYKICMLLDRICSGSVSDSYFGILINLDLFSEL